MSERAKRLLCSMTHDTTMPSAKITGAACAILVLLGLLMFVSIGTYGIASNQVTLASYGSITQPPIANNVVTNGNFNNGFTGWSGSPGWKNPPNSQGFGFIDTADGHDSAPCLKLENDPYGISASWSDPGNAGACWQCFSVVPGQIVHIIYWTKTDADYSRSAYIYGLRVGTDGSHNGVYVGSAITLTSSNVPVVSGLPTVHWGTSTWTKVELYGTVNSGVTVMNIWIQAWNGGTPSSGGTIGSGTDFAAAYVDDVFVSIT